MSTDLAYMSGHPPACDRIDPVRLAYTHRFQIPPREHLVRALQGDAYGLSLRMLWNRKARDPMHEALAASPT